jgi:hypothetical protein
MVINSIYINYLLFLDLSEIRFEFELNLNFYISEPPPTTAPPEEEEEEADQGNKPQSNVNTRPQQSGATPQQFRPSQSGVRLVGK